MSNIDQEPMNGTLESSVTELIALGLNRLESEVYVHLLMQGKPMTGYSIAKLLNKPTANVYKALDSLSARGALMIDNASSRLCTAIPAEEFLQNQERQYQKQIKQAGSALKSIQYNADFEGIYQLQSSELALDRARQILDAAEKVVILDCFPAPLKALLPAVEAAVARGVHVMVQAYEPVSIAGADIVQAFLSERTLTRWGGQQCNLVMDGREVLLCYFDQDLKRVHQAIWSRSLYLSNIMFMGLRQEFLMHRLFHLRELEDKQPFIDFITKLGPPSIDEVPGIREFIDGTTLDRSNLQ